MAALSLSPTRTSVGTLPEPGDMTLERLGDTAEFRGLPHELAEEAPEPWATILRTLAEGRDEA